MTSAELAAALLIAVSAQDFGSTADRLRSGSPVEVFPSIDLAVVAFPENGPPIAANVLFSRDFPRGLIAVTEPQFGAVTNVRYLADQRDAQNNSAAWLPGADWNAMAWRPLAGNGPARFVAPYPASLIKLMVLVGVAREIDAGRSAWNSPWSHQGEIRAVRAWADEMVVVSSNTATSALVALLHHTGAIRTAENATLVNRVNAGFAEYGLGTLRLDSTRPDGGWMNRDGSGIGHLHMTAWDTVRLLWLLDEAAPAPPWLPAGLPPLVASASRGEVRRILEAQALHEVLSSASLAGAPGWRPGIPALLPERWIAEEGTSPAGERRFPADLRPANARAQVRFAHKTGTTENFLSDAGIVTGIPPFRRHYLIAVLSNLGTRYREGETGATTWRIPALGGAIDRVLADSLERRP
jgi:hypothetical protein